MTTTVLPQHQINTAIKSRQHLKDWLANSGREWIVINSSDWVDALPFPDGHEMFRQMCDLYREHRATLPVMKQETLTIEELDRAIRYLVRQASELDSNWSLEDPAL